MPLFSVFHISLEHWTLLSRIALIQPHWRGFEYESPFNIMQKTSQSDLTMPLQNPHFFRSLSHSQVDFVVCFGLLSCCITKMHSSFRAKGMDAHFPFQDFLVEQNSQFHQLQQVVQLPKQQNSPRPSWPSSSLLVWCSHYGTLVYTLHGRCNATQTFHKIVYFSCHSTECFPKSLRDHQDFF